MIRQSYIRMLIGTLAAFSICFGAPLAATPPRSSNPQIFQPSRDGGSTQSGSSGSRGFDWGRDWPAVVGPMLQGGSQMPQHGSPQYYPRPQRYPDYSEYPEGSSSFPPPDSNRYWSPETIRVTPPENVAVPEANVVTVEVPQQFSPMDGRVWEVSVREARCYSGSLAELIDQALDKMMTSVGKGTDAASMRQQVHKIQEMIAANASWQEMEPAVRALAEVSPVAGREGIGEQYEHILQMILVRDAFLKVGHSGPRGRGGPIKLARIPTGMLWIVFDPTLAVGTGLLVNDNVLVCGSGGRGDLWIEQTFAASALGLPVGIGEPVPDVMGGEEQPLDEAIIITNKKEAATPVHFVLDNREPYSLEPGQQQRLDANRRWIIEFDRGNRQGTARYSLTQGAYEFRVVDGKWELVKLTFNVTLDNHDGDQDFQCVIENQVVTVPAGESIVHKSKVPVIVEFDRGAGPDSLARKNLNKSGTFKVAVNTDTNYLDLFAQTEPPGKRPLAATPN
jgi:hypothetical protein